MENTASIAKPIFTATSAFSLLGVLVLLFVAYAGANALLPRRAKRVDRLTFIWLASALLFCIYADANEGHAC